MSRLQAQVSPLTPVSLSKAYNFYQLYLRREIPLCTLRRGEHEGRGLPPSHPRSFQGRHKEYCSNLGFEKLAQLYNTSYSIIPVPYLMCACAIRLQMLISR